MGAKMLLSKRFVASALLVATLLALLSPSSKADPEQQQQQELNEKSEELKPQPGGARAQFRLPKLFDFGLFKRLFRKSYRTLAEELARQKIFLGRAFQAFVSAVSYKHARSSSYLGVNHMSDMSPAEIERTKISHQKLAGPRHRHTNEQQLPTSPASEPGPVPVAELDDIRAELAHMERQRGSRPGFGEALAELQGLGRAKRQAEGSGRRQLSLDDLVPAGEPERRSAKFVARVPGNNPAYEPIELMSQGLGDEANDQAPSLTESVIGVITSLPGMGYLSMVSQALSDTFMGAPEQVEEPQELPDVVWVDHRRSECLMPIKNQGKCGSCYAFATMALFEWMFCMNTGKLVSFSEQYMVDCMKLVDKFMEVDGCEGSDLDTAADFVKLMGLELDSKYPYRAEAHQCPHTNETSISQVGYIRPQVAGSLDVGLSLMKKHIKEAPILVGIFLGPNFRSYAGGVDENLDCQEEDSHAMLAVGRGREDGKKYWLVRNSHSDLWGQKGYWKVSHEALKRCLSDRVGVRVLGAFPQKGYKNPTYNGPSKKKKKPVEPVEPESS